MLTKKKIIILIIFLPLALSVIFHVVVINSLTIDGKRLNKIIQEKEIVSRENENLKYEISKQGTISNIQERALELGMDSVKVSFFDPDENLAFSD